VELMGGYIRLESEPGVGSTFYFTVWLGVGSGIGGRRVVPARLDRLRVLVVDDNPAACEILQESLTSIARKVDVANSGKDALSAVRRHDADEPYDIVFMDWRMPGMDGLQASRYIKSDETLSHQPAIVLVTAFGREEVREEAERLQLDGYLVKPVTRSMIVDTLVNVFAEEGAARTAAVDDGEESHRLRGVRILLTEDNEINQQIAIELLEGAGATVAVAGNGREAVDRLARRAEGESYDLVLMDLQMPEMDGFQATAKIRSDPRFAKLPIVAMTAHATIEERQRCLAAGMDDHVAKPIDPDQLIETVVRVCGAARQPKPAEADAALATIAGLDARDGLARVGGNRDLYRKLLRQFVDEQGGAVVAVRGASRAGDVETAARVAHSLKGVAGNLGAGQVYAAAGALEQALRAHAPAPELDARIEALAGVLDPLVSAVIAALPNTHAAPAAPQLTPAGTADSVEAAARLSAMLTEFDPGAAAFLETNQAALRALFDDERWRRLRELVDSYAFSDAQAELDRAMRSLGA
jgi:two-component system sensor histidine kinase/response regulator